MPKKKQVDIEREAIHIVRKEKQEWETATAFVTERVAFQMRNLIRQLRKNYWGIFDEPTDPTTGREKVWIHLTKTFVENVVKNIDLDTKDINFRSKKPSSRDLTAIVRAVVKNRLDEIFFGETLDEMERSLAIDGTAVWKTTETKVDGKITADIRPVDLLNFYIDPTARNIQEAYRVTERAIVDPEWIRSQKGWINTEDVVGVVGLPRIDSETNYSMNSGTAKMVDVYEMWGKIPKGLITGKKDDMDMEVDGRIVASGLERTGNERIHLIEETKETKPYEEAWYTRVPGRWYGEGVAEKLMMQQLYINTIVNIRINRSYVSQLGIFKIKKQAGVTPQMISRLSTNGAILVNSMDDVQQLAMQEASQASYSDESNAYTWSERITSAFQAVTGESLPASTSATATALQSQGAQSAFVLIREGLGFFLQRWVKRHFLPIVMKGLKPSEIIRLTDDASKLRSFDERIVNELLYKELEKLNKEGVVVDIEQVEQERQAALSKLQGMDRDRFVDLQDKIDFTDYDVQVFITNEEMDKGVMVQNLMALMQTIQDPAQQEEILNQITDLMGLSLNVQQKPQPVQPEVPAGAEQVQGAPGQQAPPQGLPQVPSQDPTALIQEANTPF